MSLKPSTTLPPITPNANPVEYHKLGQHFARGDKRRIMSRSELMDFVRCPHRWREGTARVETDSLEWGSLLDCIVLTPDRFEATYARTPETYPAEPKKKGDPIEHKPWNWNATYCREWRTAREAEGKTVIKSELASEAWKAASIIWKDHRLAEFIRSSDRQVQVCVEYHDPDTKLVIPIKCLIDLVPAPTSEYGKMLGDLKTTCSASPGKWARHVFDQGYDSQAALYLDAYNAATGRNYQDFAHLVQENVAPYETARRLLSPEYIQIGRANYMRALVDYCYCLKHDFWPGYDDKDDQRGGTLDGWRIVEPAPWMLMNTEA